MPESVHLCDFPLATGEGRDTVLEAEMEAVKTVVALGRQLRVQFDLKVRQPLAGLHVVCRDAAKRGRLAAVKDIVADELNVKEVWFGPDESRLAHLRAKPNFRVLGPQLGADVKRAAGVIRHLDRDHLERILAGDTVTLQVGERQVELGSDEVDVERVPKEGLAVGSSGDLVVALEVQLTPELLSEGLAREFVNKVQNMRKAAELEVSDRIRMEVSGDGEVSRAVRAHRDYIAGETLCVELRVVASAGGGERCDLNGHAASILVSRA